MIRFMIATTALALTAACAHTATATPPNDLPTAAEMPGPADGVYPSMMRASADMISADGNTIGAANILGGPNGVVLRITFDKGALTPGWHGLHLHAVGDCSDLGVFKKSGGHVGKIEGGHGLLNHKGPEGGDIPNIWAAADGSAGYEAVTTLASMTELVDADGAAIIVHEGEDDHMSQPIGGAGGRVACGVIS